MPTLVLLAAGRKYTTTQLDFAIRLMQALNRGDLLLCEPSPPNPPVTDERDEG